MAYSGSQIGVTSTAVVTVVAHSGNSPLEARIQMTSGTCYLGSSGVTSSGFTFSTGDSPFTVLLMAGDTLFAASTQAVALKVLEHSDY